MLDSSNKNVVTLLIGNTSNCSEESDRTVTEHEAKKLAGIHVFKILYATITCIAVLLLISFTASYN